ncbi:hypothetical protein PMAYCL1PPCAC_11200, partial [Pristionchus mayeri]
RNVKIGKLIFNVNTTLNLESALRLMPDFPTATHEMILQFIPDQKQLLSIPPLESLTISTYSNEISIDLLFTLLESHKNLKLDRNPIEICSEDWLEVLKILSADSRARTVELTLRCSTIVRYLKEFGISEFSEAGSYCLPFEILRSVPAGPRKAASLKLRYKRCSVKIEHLTWTC